MYIFTSSFFDQTPLKSLCKTTNKSIIRKLIQYCKLLEKYLQRVIYLLRKDTFFIIKHIQSLEILHVKSLIVHKEWYTCCETDDVLSKFWYNDYLHHISRYPKTSHHVMLCGNSPTFSIYIYGKFQKHTNFHLKM